MADGNGVPFLDAGTAPEYFADGLHSVEVKGSVSRFVLYVSRRLPDGKEFREIPFTCILPNEAIGPAIMLTMETLPSGLIFPAARQQARRLAVN